MIQASKFDKLLIFIYYNCGRLIRKEVHLLSAAKLSIIVGGLYMRLQRLQCHIFSEGNFSNCWKNVQNRQQNVNCYKISSSFRIIFWLICS
ncbi:unnamed protein product [Paramecium primaurelia]|uniref:Uncharacterized protein n=1 Tax=Paramecium primaurelia TaxID=5886 RepID=A0A8S1PUA3_PARPR|nr:unnamed protein product [Paramecium primaurelia]